LVTLLKVQLRSVLAYFASVVIYKSKICIILNPGTNVIKHFTAVSYAFSQQARSFVPGKPFQSSLIIAGKAGAYLNEAPFTWATIR
jgi:hypothetical protein